MVAIKNISVNDKEVAFDYYPENKQIKHYLKYDRKTKTLLVHEKSSEYTSDVYAKHAYRAVEKIIEENQEIPQHYTVAWY